MTTRATISAFVICCNEEENIERCLRSLAWCDEIVVVDSGSTDRTLEIARRYTDRIMHNPWPGFLEQKRFALGQCRMDWVFNVDADEEVSPELAAEIQKALEPGGTHTQFNGFLIPRVVFYFGKWWRKGGWWPEFRLRLCRKAVTRWGGLDPHEHAIVDGPVGKLSGELRHFTYTDLSDQVRSLNSLSSASAQALFARGHSASLIYVIVSPLTRFVKFYFLKYGFREGIPGFLVAVLEAGYAFLKYAKLWELTRKRRQGSSAAKEL